MGIIKTGLKLFLFSAIVYGSYYAGFTGIGKDYGLKQIGKQYYLVYHKEKLIEPITNNFQLGNIEYRIKGLMAEDKDKLKKTIDKILSEYK